MGLLDKRFLRSPFEYPEAHQYWLEQETNHWLHTKIQMGSDQNDWNYKLTDAERSVVGRTLKGFVQIEVLIGDYWSVKVTRWFKKPEIQAMAMAFANMESIHTEAYAYLQEQLSMRDFDAFMQEPSAKAKIDRLIAAPGKTRADIARSLAVFSAFNEGVSLFSQFAVLMSFDRRNLLKGVGKIIEYSVKDESLHSHAGCWLFRTLVQEYPEILTDDLKEELYEAARLTVELEDEFIDQSFSLGDIESICQKDLKAYIRFRTNTKLKDIGLRPLYKNLNTDCLENLDWFDVLSQGTVSQDFFAGRVTTYGIGMADFSCVESDEAWKCKV